MADIKGEDLEFGTLHVLKSRYGPSEKVFEWVKGGWSTPGTGYHTDPVRMSALGWTYKGRPPLLTAREAK